MALHQNDHAKGRLTTPVPYCAGMVAHVVFTHTFSTAFTSATDVLEIGMIPAGAKLVEATVIGEGMGALTVDVATMTGDAGEPLTSAGDARALTAEVLFNDASVNNTEVNATAKVCKDFPVSSSHRGLGVTVSGDVSASASKKVSVALRYTY